LIFSFSFCKAQWVSIPDANFVTWLQSHYPTCMNGNLMDTTCSGIVNVTLVDCSYQNISDLTGIQFFDNLDTLECRNNNLTQFPILHSTLVSFDGESNQFTSLPALPSSMLSFDCACNQIDSMPPLPLGLTLFFCDSNLLTSLPTLPNGIFYFSCSENQLTSLPNLPNALLYLHCWSNQLTSLPPIPPQLQDVCCSNNQISSLPELPDTMVFLQIANNPINCLPPFHYIDYDYPWFDINGTNIQCLPNVIQHPPWSFPYLDSIPICDVFNQNGCPVGWDILGQAVLDGDSSCATLNDGIPIPNLKMNLYAGSNLLQQVTTNLNGNYSFDVPLGNYFISADTSNLWYSVLCPSGNSTPSNLTAIDSIDYNVDFRLACNQGFDIGAWDAINFNVFFPGAITWVSIVAGNLGQYIYNLNCISGVSGEVKVVINGPASFDTSTMGVLTPILIGDTLIYSVPDFSLINGLTDFAFNVLTDSTAQIGDAICFDVSVTPTAGDNNISNNTVTHCFEVLGSFDPNEKEVSPIGDLNYPYNDWLTYTIHFQNTGTAPAEHIQILDTLDSDLDESTFQLISSSHDPMIQLFGNQVRFNFVNINLPDSTTNSEGSKGYVSYRIKPKPNLPIGTSINN
ncbi:MAG: hypothetical protein WCI97_10530, partial [Bacteroidota bacterium]